MNRTSVFNIKIDFDKSQGSYVFDKNTNINHNSILYIYIYSFVYLVCSYFMHNVTVKIQVVMNIITSIIK